MRRASVKNPLRDLAMIEARASFDCSSVTRGKELRKVGEKVQVQGQMRWDQRRRLGGFEPSTRSRSFAGQGHSQKRDENEKG